MNSHASSSEPDHLDPPFSAPHVIVEATQKLIAELIEATAGQADLNRWQVDAAELDVDTPSTVRAAWMILVTDEVSREVLGSTVVFEPHEAEAAAA